MPQKKISNFCWAILTNNIPMADKEKRLRKILVKKGFKGLLKTVGTLEEAHIIIIENKQCIRKTMFIGKDTYNMFLEEGRTFPEDLVHYTASNNPRNTVNIERKIMTNAYGIVRRVPE